MGVPTKEVKTKSRTQELEPLTVVVNRSVDSTLFGRVSMRI